MSAELCYHHTFFHVGLERTGIDIGNVLLGDGVLLEDIIETARRLRAGPSLSWRF